MAGKIIKKGSKMEFYNTKAKEIEKRNSNYIKLVNTLGRKLANDSLSHFELQAFFKDMAQYSSQQFEDINQIIDEYHIYEKQVQTHKQNQKMFIKEMVLLCDSVSEDLSKAKMLLDFLIFWMDSQVLGQDKVLLRQISLISSGKTPKEAYELTSISPNGNDTLIRTLNEMLDLLLQRNRELSESNKILAANLEQKQKELLYLNQKYGSIVTVDETTKLPNRKQALKDIDKYINNGVKDESKLGLLLISIGNYDELLKKFGARIDEELILRTIDIIKNTTRSDDVVYFMRRNELLVLCPSSSETSIINIANLLIANTKNSRDINSLFYNKDSAKLNIGIELIDKNIALKDVLKNVDDKLKMAEDSKEAKFVI